MSLTAQLATIATHLIASLGYGGLALGLVIDSMGVPIPSEVLIPLAGALARDGHFSLVIVIIVATVAQTAGAVISYWLGALGGLPLVQRYGKYVLFRQHELDKTQALFERWGAWLTFGGRMIPGIRTYIGYPAGLARMPFGKFLLATVLGSLGWTIILAELGYWLSGQLSTIDSLVSRFGLLALGVAIVGLAWYLWQSSKRKGRS
jgi:membrane protein DedA with SNARE-associated domain